MPPKKRAAVAAKTRVSAAVMTTVAVLAVGAVAAAAAFFTVALRGQPFLTITLASSGITEQPAATRGAEALNLQLRGGQASVTLTKLALSYYGDTDGDFSNGIANNLSPASAVGDCVLQSGGRRLSTAQVNPSSRALVFSFSYPLAAKRLALLNVTCDLKTPTDGTPDVFAFGLANVRAVQGSGSLPPGWFGRPAAISGVSFGGPSSLNMNGQAAVRILAPNAPAAAGGTLNVSLSQPPSSSRYVVGAQNVPMVGILLQSSAAAAKISSVSFVVSGTSSAGDLVASSRFTSCTMKDAGTGTVVGGPATIGTADAGRKPGKDYLLTFRDAFTISTTPVKLIVQCGTTSTGAANGSETWTFEVNDPRDVIAVGSNGNAMTVTDQDGGAFVVNGDEIVQQTFASAGSLSVTLDGSTPKSTIVLGTSTDVPVSTFTFKAANEDVVVRGFTLKNCPGMLATGNDNCTEAGESVGADEALRSVHISYADATGAQVTKTGFVSNGRVTFTGLQFPVRDGISSQLTVRADMNRVGTGAATSGMPVQLNLVATGFDAVGNASGNALSLADGSVVFAAPGQQAIPANQMILRKTKPTVTLASGSPSGAGVPGLSDVFRFNVSADAHGFVALDELTFKVTSTDNAGTGWNKFKGYGSVGLDASKFELYDEADPSQPIQGGGVSLHNAAGAVAAPTDPVAYFVIFLNKLQIGAGQTKTFVLKMDTSGASSALDDSILIDIPDQVSASRLSPAQLAMEWDDDVAAHQVDGSLVKNLPVTGGTIVY